MYHFIEILEPDMCSLAIAIYTLGYRVNGSYKKGASNTESILKEKGIKLEKQAAENINDDMIIIKSDTLSDDNEELLKAEELGLKIYTCSQMRKRLSSLFQSIVINGCIGKEFTNELMTYTLANIIGCNYMLKDGRGYANRENKFLCMQTLDNNQELSPYYSVITNIDLNYANNDDNIDLVIENYHDFASKTEKMVLANGDDSYTHLLNINTPIFYYGLNEDNEILAKEVEYTKEGTKFEVHVEDNYYGNFELPIYGKAMLLNVLSVIGMCYYERIDAKYVSSALKEFFMCRNLFNEKYIDDSIVINSFINHPRDVRNIIKAIRQKYPEKLLVTISSGDLFNENIDLNDMYIENLSLADKLFIDSSNDNEYSKNLLSKVENAKYIDLSDEDGNLDINNTVYIIATHDRNKKLEKNIENLLKNKSKEKDQRKIKR